ncbi:MAG: PIN domain-containing protein [Microthrixaceae bacterium]
MRLIDAFDQAPVTEGDHRRALEVQHQLSATGRHRGLSLVDALVAAVAESRSLTVLHYDADFDLVAVGDRTAHRVGGRAQAPWTEAGRDAYVWRLR